MKIIKDYLFPQYTVYYWFKIKSTFPWLRAHRVFRKFRWSKIDIPTSPRIEYIDEVVVFRGSVKMWTSWNTQLNTGFPIKDMTEEQGSMVTEIWNEAIRKWNEKSNDEK